MLESRQQGGDFGGGGGNVNKRWVEERAAERELLQQDISERMEKWRGGGLYPRATTQITLLYWLAWLRRSVNRPGETKSQSYK